MTSPAGNHRSATNRRSFLKSLGTGVFAPLVLPGSVLGRDGGTAPNERITIGMIGAGNQGSMHTQVMLGMPDAQMVAVCDPVRAKREARQTQGGGGLYPDPGPRVQGLRRLRRLSRLGAALGH